MSSILKKLILSFVIVLSANVIFAQKIPIKYTFIDGESHSNLSFKKSVKNDSTAIWNYLDDLKNSLIKKGFSGHSIDKIKVSQDTLFLTIYFGASIQYSQIEMDSKNVNYKFKAGRKNKKINQNELEDYVKSIVHDHENSGYPFVKVSTDTVYVSDKDKTFYVNLKLEKGPEIKVDTVLFKGNLKLKPKFLYNYWGIFPDDPFNSKKIENIDKLNSRLSFVSRIKDTEIEFTEDKALIYTYLNNKKTNYFTGIIGLYQDQNSDKGIQFTGEVELLLKNSFGIGEELAMDWMKYIDDGQKLNLGLSFPYIGISNFGFATNFHFLKQDSTFMNINPSFDLLFMQVGGNSIRIFYDYFNSFLINSAVINESVKSITFHKFGFGTDYKQLDNIYNPVKGGFVEAEFAIGNKIIEGQLDDVSNMEGTLQIDLAYYLPLSSNQTLLLRNQTASLLSFSGRNAYAENEMFRIGGLNNFRGIDDESITTSLYTVLNIEYRFLFASRSNFALFSDWAYWEYNGYESFTSDYPFSFGAGINLETKAGILSFYYALSQQFDNPIIIENSKIHLGFKASF